MWLMQLEIVVSGPPNVADERKSQITNHACDIIEQAGPMLAQSTFSDPAPTTIGQTDYARRIW
jgi:hypothetical protein